MPTMLPVELPADTENIEELGRHLSTIKLTNTSRWNQGLCDKEWITLWVKKASGEKVYWSFDRLLRVDQPPSSGTMIGSDHVQEFKWYWQVNGTWYSAAKWVADPGHFFWHISIHWQKTASVPPFEAVNVDARQTPM